MCSECDTLRNQLGMVKRERDAMEDMVAGQEYYQALVNDERAKQTQLYRENIIYLRYINFLQSCTRSGQNWHGDVESFLALETNLT